MTIWEYTGINFNTPDELNDYGKQGWELVAVLPNNVWNAPYRGWMKRPLLAKKA